MKKTIILIFSVFMILNSTAQEEEFIGRGLALEEMGEFRLAIEMYDSALFYNAESAIAYYNRGVCFAALGQNGDALTDYNKALKLDMFLANAYYNRSLIHKQMQNFVLASLDLEYYLEMNPDDTMGYLALASVYESDDNYIKAFEQYELALENGLQKKHMAYLAMGLCKFYLEKDEEAENLFNLSIDLNPENRVAYYYRARVKMALNKWDEAINDFTVYLRESPMDIKSIYNRSEAYRRTGKLNEALEDIEKLIILEPAEWRWIYEKANCLLQLKQDAEAENYYGKALILSDEPSLILLMRGISRYNQNKDEEACFDWEQSSLLGEEEAQRLFNKHCKKD